MSKWATREMALPHAFIQWKGTDICMDFHCLCGRICHLDAEFAYAVQCPHCQRVYEMSAMIEARLITDDAELHSYPADSAKILELGSE